MLVKIHLKTACGCEKTFFETNAPQVYRGYKVPILVTVPRPTILRGPETIYGSRDFTLVSTLWKSSRRVEAFYEEVVY